MHTSHVQYDLMEYVTNRLDERERTRIERHLQECPKCSEHLRKISAVDSYLKLDSPPTPSPVYFSTILPRVRERLAVRRLFPWDYGVAISKIVIPLTVLVFLVLFLTRTRTETASESIQTEALHQTMMDLNEDEVIQAIEKEYLGSLGTPTIDVAAAGVAEHLEGDQFLQSAISKQIENEEVSEMDIDGMISDLNGDQINQILSSLSERSTL